MKRAKQNCHNRLRSPIIVDNMIKECIFNPNYYQAMLANIKMIPDFQQN